MSGKEVFSPAGRHVRQAGLPGSGGSEDGSPPPNAPAAQPTPAPDDVTRTSAGRKRSRSPGREVAPPLPLTGSTLEMTEVTEVTLSHLGKPGIPSSEMTSARHNRRVDTPTRIRDDYEVTEVTFSHLDRPRGPSSEMTSARHSGRGDRPSRKRDDDEVTEVTFFSPG